LITRTAYHSLHQESKQIFDIIIVRRGSIRHRPMASEHSLSEKGKVDRCCYAKVMIGSKPTTSRLRVRETHLYFGPSWNGELVADGPLVSVKYSLNPGHVFETTGYCQIACTIDRRFAIQGVVFCINDHSRIEHAHTYIDTRINSECHKVSDYSHCTVSAFRIDCALRANNTMVHSRKGGYIPIPHFSQHHHDPYSSSPPWAADRNRADFPARSCQYDHTAPWP